ncbi:hypothetical protein [Desulfovibrio sp.]|uniref:hypothetical protein n=1 Tax=Desulfovibrio sp. TaxID=885 RepID=UPI003AB329BD
MSQELYAKPAAPVKTASYLVRLRGLPPQRLSMTHRALLAFLQQAGQQPWRRRKHGRSVS